MDTEAMILSKLEVLDRIMAAVRSGQLDFRRFPDSVCTDDEAWKGRKLVLETLRDEPIKLLLLEGTGINKPVALEISGRHGLLGPALHTLDRLIRSRWDAEDAAKAAVNASRRVERDAQNTRIATQELSRLLGN